MIVGVFGLKNNNMKIAYIILAHRDPELLKKTINKLKDDNSEFFIHIDLKSNVSRFENLKETSSVHIVKDRVDVKWGSITIVQAVLNSIKEALLDKEINYFYILSGQDYPIKSKREIYDFALKNKTYLKYFTLPTNRWKGGGIHRYKRFHFIISRNRYLRRIVNIINFFLPRRKIPHNHIPYGGDFWCGLNIDSAKYILNFIDKEKKYINFFRYTYLADEIFFQTVLLNSNDIIKENIVNEKITYVDWSVKPTPPKTLCLEDFEIIKNSKYLFARKLDSKHSKELIQLIDKNT